MFAEFISNEEEEFYMICPKCGSEMPDDSTFCTRCGASLHTGTQENQNSQGTPYGYGNPQGNNGAYYGNPQMNNGMPYGQPYVDPKDHSTEFDGKDIAEHKLFAMLPYLLGILGTTWHFLWRRILLMSDFMCVRESGYLCLKFCWD